MSAPAAQAAAGRWALLLWAAALLLYVPGLGIEALRDWDEGTFAQVAREIRAGGWSHLLHPTLWGEPYLNKPPLGPGLIAGSFALFGEGAFAARLPLAILASGTVPLVYLTARRAGMPAAGALSAAAVCLTLLPVMRHGRLAMLDGATTSFGIAMFLCLWHAAPGRRGWTFAAGAAVAAMALTKGLLAAPFVAIGLAWLAVQRAPMLRRAGCWAALAAGMAPAAAWYAAQWVRYGDGYLQAAVVRQGFARLVEAVENNSGTPWYYLLEILKFGWPWLAFLPAGLAIAWRHRRAPWASLALIWGGGWLLVVSAMPTKLPWYVYPAWPAVALLSGAGLHRAALNPGPARWILPVVAAAALVGVWYASPLGPDPTPLLVLAAATVAFGFSAAFWLWPQNGPRAAVLTVTTLYGGLLLFSLTGRSVWELNEDFPVQPVAAAIRAQVPPGAPVFTTHPHHRPSLDFYAGRRVIPRTIDDPSHPGGWQGFWLLSAGDPVSSQGGIEELAAFGAVRLVRVGEATR